VNPGKRLKPGATIEYHPGGLHAPMSAPVVLTGTVEGYVDDSRGGRLVRFEPAEGLSLDDAMHEAGRVPLPPYITDYHGDPEKYQTVYAMHDEHSAAAPTAGLHFTPELIDRLRERGIDWATVELEVGIDTFRLVEEDDPTQHVMHTERYHVGPDVVDAVHATHAAGHRVVAVGTTSVRSLESAWDADATAADGTKGDIVVRRDATTNLYLMPGSEFHVIDAMITNFHVPRSTLMMLVSAFATREQIMDAYHEAIDRRYRMLSFGDAMLIE
jgi:S-adenosylmethionine:tRNA ribosyltransferase-isomerase